MENKNKKSLSDYFGVVALKLGGQIHLRTLRDSFASIMPFMILAGFITFVNYVILEPSGFMGKIVNPQTLTEWQKIGISVSNGTLNIITLLIGVAIAYYLSVNRGYKNVLASILVTLSSIFVVTPFVAAFKPEGIDEFFTVNGVVPVSYMNASGMFVGIIVGLVATDLFIKLSSNKKLEINIAGDIPPAVIKSFNVLIPIMVNILIFAVLSFLLNAIFKMDFNQLISMVITKPLSHVTTSLFGFLFLMTLANLFFGFGIHQAVIANPLLDPFLLQNMQENMTAYANHAAIPHIINSSFKDTFGIMGGSGNTIALLIAIFVFGRRKDYKDVSKMSFVPGIFNINEPVIFGLPIVFNPMLIIPFVIAPIFSLGLAYFATSVGLVNHVVVQIPWTTPPIISGFLATGGDWRASVLQIIIIIVTIFLYLPFLKIDERVSKIEIEKEKEEA